MPGNHGSIASLGLEVCRIEGYCQAADVSPEGNGASVLLVPSYSRLSTLCCKPGPKYAGSIFWEALSDLCLRGTLPGS